MLNFFARIKHRLHGNYIREPRKIDTKYIESPVRIDKNTHVGKNVEIGKYTSIGKNNHVNPSSADNHTIIGRFCSIASNIIIGAEDHPTNWLSTSSFQYSKDKLFRNINVDTLLLTRPQKVVIGNDVWIGSNVFIKAGISIGHGAIIGAGAIVVKDVPNYAIVAGNPAKLIRYRFDEETIDQLLTVKWWDLDPELLKKLPFKDIDKAIELIKNIRGKND